MTVRPQLALPLVPKLSVSRADFIVGAANLRAVAFVDSWPNWPVPAAAIHGPAGAGKSHLVAIWQNMSGARVVSAAELAQEGMRLAGPLAIEDVDSVPASGGRDQALFAALEAASPAVPLLLSGKDPPSSWECVLPDLASRFSALAAFPMWTPDEELLSALARKLFADRQLSVPPQVIVRMLHALERSPGAVRDFVASADAKALAEARPVNLALVRELILAGENGRS